MGLELPHSLPSESYKPNFLYYTFVIIVDILNPDPQKLPVYSGELSATTKSELSGNGETWNPIFMLSLGLPPPPLWLSLSFENEHILNTTLI